MGVRPLKTTAVLEIDGDKTLEYFNKATYDLGVIKTLIMDGPCTVTQTAVNGGVEVGYATKEEIKERVLKLKRTEIYKTMTADNAEKLWQDVYKTKEESGIVLYIKIQINHKNEAVIIQLKISN
ncbi:MAG: hypothetical protein JWO30_4463 [Fibrobacteres bacterium]|nr:hypothetical protein [Fibrobacterota bacterium]